MNDILKKLKHYNLLFVLSSICLILGVILPYVKFSVLGFSKSLSLINYWEGKVILFIVIINIFVFLKDVISIKFHKLYDKTILDLISDNFIAKMILSILPLVFLLYLANRLKINTAFAKQEIGFYLLWIGALSSLINVFLSKVKVNDVNL